MEVEACDLPKQPTLVESSVNLDRCGRPVRRRRAASTKASLVRPRKCVRSKMNNWKFRLFYAAIPIETSFVD